VNYTITFDLIHPGSDAYESIYIWAHRNGGYHFFKFEGDRRWGRLPNTTIVMPLNVSSASQAINAFKSAWEACGYRFSHISALAGIPATLSVYIDAASVPAYAKVRYAA